MKNSILSDYTTPFDVDLQWFADDPPVDIPSTDPPGDTGTTDNQELRGKMAKMEETLQKVQRNFDQKNTEFQKLKEENENLKKAQMKEEERKEYERKQYEETLQKKENELKEKEFELQKTQINVEKNIPVEMGNMIKGHTVEEYTKNIDALSKIINDRVNAEVEKRINEKLGNGNPPAGGDSGTYPNNPFSKEFLNLTKQGEIIRKDPELAKKMKAAAAG